MVVKRASKNISHHRIEIDRMSAAAEGIVTVKVGYAGKRPARFS